jgi:hypothetical protein
MVSAVRLGERTGEHEGITKAFEILNMLWSLRLADGEAVRLIDANQGIEHRIPVLPRRLFPTRPNCPQPA